MSGGGANSFIYEDHYRRFVPFELLVQKIQNAFEETEILFAAEERGFAPFKSEDDYFIRVIAKKIC